MASGSWHFLLANGLAGWPCLVVGWRCSSEIDHKKSNSSNKRNRRPRKERRGEKELVRYKLTCSGVINATVRVMV